MSYSGMTFLSFILPKIRWREITMHSYTLDEARNIVMRCAKQYEKNLLGRSFLVIYRDRVDNVIKELEIHFEKDNYQHLTGIE